jgi:hypothetical protein
MPATLSYPGVYIEEIPSGVHTITGVATSIAAFVGAALRGPTDDDPLSPITINGARTAQSPRGLRSRPAISRSRPRILVHGARTPA